MKPERDLVQARNPHSGKYVLIDRGTGVVLKTKRTAGPYAKVRIIEAKGVRE